MQRLIACIGLLLATGTYLSIKMLYKQIGEKMQSGINYAVRLEQRTIRGKQNELS